MGLIDLDKVILGQGEDFPPTENFLQLHTQQGQINWLAQALTELNDAAEGSTYELPVATATTLGGIKQGDGLKIAEDGTASVDATYELPVATATTLGGIKQGDGLKIAEDGTASVDATYELPVATATTLGGIKQGDGLKIAEDGTASANLGTGLEFDENGAIQATATSTLTKQVGPVKGVSVKMWNGGTTTSIAYQITSGHTYDVNNDLLIVGPANTSQKVWTDNGIYVSSVGTTTTAGQIIITLTADTTPTESIVLNVAIIYEEV